MTNTNIENKEEVKEGRFMKHLKKHRYIYMGVAGAALLSLGVRINANELKQARYDGYLLGADSVNQGIWDALAKHVKEGNLKMELVKDVTDEYLKTNMEILKKYVEAE